MQATVQRWTFANALGLGLGVVVIRAAIPGFRGDQFQVISLGDIVRLIVLTGLPVGLTMSLLQWWAIRHRLDHGTRWIPLTFGGLILGWFLGVAAGVPLGLLATALLPDQSPLAQTLIRYSIAFVIGSALGAGLGYIQSFAWRKQGMTQWGWVRASALGGGVGFSLMLLLFSLLDSVVESSPGFASAIASFVAGAVGGGMGSLIPGRFLSNLD